MFYVCFLFEFCFSCTASSCDLWPHCGTSSYHDNHIDDYQQRKRSPNSYCANLSDSVPNLSENGVGGTKKQSISQGDLLRENRMVGRSESVDMGERRPNKLVTKPPIYDRISRSGPGLLLEDREMPITRERQIKTALVTAATKRGNDGKKSTSMGSPLNLLRVGSTESSKFGLASDRLRIRYAIHASLDSILFIHLLGML